MSESVLESSKATAALITERLETVLQEARKDEAKLKRILEMRRLKRRLRLPVAKSLTPSSIAN
jgi:hypothetical protein